jgi:hypothetical protein
MAPERATIPIMNVTPDRRKTRSDDALVALHYQLLQTRREAALETIVVADASGVVVAGAGPWAACEELAAYAPILVLGHGTGTEQSEWSRISQLVPEVDVKAIDVEGQTVLLCVQGARRRTAAVDRAAAGVARILANAA